MNARALRLVVFELLRGFIDDINKDYTELGLFLKRISKESVLKKHWMENLAQPVDAAAYKS